MRYLLYTMVFALLINPALTRADPEPMSAQVEAGGALPSFFKVGNKLAFTWWGGPSMAQGFMLIDEVRGGWVRMHTLDNRFHGWIYPQGMTAVWGQ